MRIHSGNQPFQKFWTSKIACIIWTSADKNLTIARNYNGLLILKPAKVFITK